MQRMRRNSGRNMSRIREASIDALRRKLKSRRTLAITCGFLALVLVGFSAGSTVAAPAVPADVAEAVEAASSPKVALRSALKMNTQNLDSAATNERFIVKYKNGTTEGRSASAVQSRLDRFGSAFPAKARHSRRMAAGADVVTIDRKLDGKEARAFMRAVAADPNVEYIEPDREMFVQTTPNDPQYSTQWGLFAFNAALKKQPGIRAEGAWDYANGNGVVMAVVDNGVTSHSDLNANLLPGYDFSGVNRSSASNGANPGITVETSCTSVTWHGTHVAGIMGALTNNGIGVAGVAPAAKMVSARVMNACGRGVVSDIADGIVWAAGGSVPGVPVNPYPAKVINVSNGGLGQCEQTMQSAIDDATSRGAIVVVAAGNEGKDVSNFSPADCRNVINVAATNAVGLRSVSSDFGEMTDIAAPGTGILSTYNNGIKQPTTESYAQMDGTSMAAPFVAGVAALVQSIAPKRLTVAEMRNLLRQTAQPFPNGQPDQYIGPGILDASAAVTAVRAGKIPVAADFKCTQSPDSIQVTCSDLSTARGGAPITTWAWNLGTGGADMVSTKSVSPVWTYDQPGMYKISLAVTDSNGVVSKYSRPFEVKAPNYTDITNGFGPLNLGVDAGQTVYLLVSLPAGPRIGMALHDANGNPIRVGWKDLTFIFTPQDTRSTATVSVRYDSMNMAAPDCTAAMSNGVPAKCTISLPGSGGNFYAMIKASTTVNTFVLFEATNWQTPDIVTNAYR